MKRPAFQFYPRDWQTDKELGSCSIAARGMWADMLCIAHWGEPYGHLTLNGRGMTDAQIINQIRGATRRLLAELESAGVFSRASDGTIYCRRMVRDEAARMARADGGKLGAEHGHKGGIHGIMGGRPKSGEGGLITPLDGSETGVSKPPIKPPPAFASASASESISDRSCCETPQDTARAKAAKVNGGDQEIANPKAKTGQQWGSAAWVRATAITVGVQRRAQEPDADFTDRVRAAFDQRMRSAQADWNERRKA